MKQVAVTSPEPPLEALGRFSQVKVVEAVVEVPSNCSITVLTPIFRVKWI